MTRIFIAAAVAGLLAGATAADEVEATLEAALEAYRAGDIALAEEEAQFAATLLGQMKAEGLKGYLPEPLAGWERREADDAAQSMAGFGGGVLARGRYAGPPGDVEIQLMAENQLVASMAAVLSNPAMMSQMGTVRRVGRQKLVVTREGEVQALIAGKVLVQISGSAPEADKLAYFEALDLEALAAF
jgi:hypothetical protein